MSILIVSELPFYKIVTKIHQIHKMCASSFFCESWSQNQRNVFHYYNLPLNDHVQIFFFFFKWLMCCSRLFYGSNCRCTEKSWVKILQKFFCLPIYIKPYMLQQHGKKLLFFFFSGRTIIPINCLNIGHSLALSEPRVVDIIVLSGVCLPCCVLLCQLYIRRTTGTDIFITVPHKPWPALDKQLCRV